MNDDISPVPALREVLRRATIADVQAIAQEEATEAVDQNIRQLADERARLAVQHRTEARQDAVNVVARARARRNPPLEWSAAEADAIHLIAELLLKLQGQDKGGDLFGPQREGG
jgi:SpoVK/Ycf46/Vps4 family AAA+-type ATPase